MCKMVFKKRQSSQRSFIRGFTRHFWLFSKRFRRTHRTKAQPKCEICCQYFSCIGNLNRHMKLHTDYERFQCKICHRTYSNYSNFKIHIPRWHKLDFELGIEIESHMTNEGKKDRPMYINK